MQIAESHMVRTGVSLGDEYMLLENTALTRIPNMTVIWIFDLSVELKLSKSFHLDLTQAQSNIQLWYTFKEFIKFSETFNHNR